MKERTYICCDLKSFYASVECVERGLDPMTTNLVVADKSRTEKTISVEFKLYLVKEFERLKTEEMKQLGWDIKRNLAKINYRIHTDAIKENLIPPELSARQISLVYANEADVLNMALFGMTAKQWRDANPDLKGNIRDYANVSQLVCLSNLENLNAVFINEEIPQAERLAKLNAIAISQMKVLTEDHRILQLEDKEDTELPRTTDEN